MLIKNINLEPARLTTHSKIYITLYSPIVVDMFPVTGSLDSSTSETWSSTKIPRGVTLVHPRLCHMRFSSCGRHIRPTCSRTGFRPENVPDSKKLLEKKEKQGLFPETYNALLPWGSTSRWEEKKLLLRNYITSLVGATKVRGLGSTLRSGLEPSRVPKSWIWLVKVWESYQGLIPGNILDWESIIIWQTSVEFFD